LYELAFNLGMGVYQIEQEMPAAELRMWAQYLKARPYGWKDDLRTSYLLSAQGVKKSGKQIFSSLAQMAKWDQEAEDEEKMRSSLGKSIFGVLLESANKK